MRATPLLSKIDSDFAGALQHWSRHFDCWTFVHNDRDGLGAPIVAHLLDLESANRPKRVGTWGYAELRDRLFGFSDRQISMVLGGSPTADAVSALQMDDIRLVVQNVARQEPQSAPDLRPVSASKLGENNLSSNVAVLLQAGRRKSALVQRLFNGWPDPQFGDSVVQSFHAEYLRLRSNGLEPDLIFEGLYEYVLPTPASPALMAASLAVLTHLFDYCDIFERGQTDDTTHEAAEQRAGAPCSGGPSD
jgi:hypothetical protein